MRRGTCWSVFVFMFLAGRPGRPADVVPGPDGVVVSASQPASEVGAAILEEGGNAIDAAVATGFALAVTYPAAGNIGGGGFMVVRLPDGTATSFDFRETAPAAARPDMFLDEDANIDTRRIAAGYLAVAVPGTVRGLALAHARLGRLAWQRLVEPVVRGAFLGHDVISMGPPSSGGTVLLAMLGMAETLGLDQLPRLSPEAIHLATEIRRRAYLDRARFLGDPDFSDVPADRLASPAHARSLAATIDRRRATPSLQLGGDLLAEPAAESPETTHYSVVDAAGLAVATTYTLEGSFGSHLVVPGTGFLLNNEMGDFNRKPGTTTLRGDIGTPANVIAPGKRMLSSMTPTIVAQDGRLVLVTGSPGGRTITNTVFDVITSVVALGHDGRSAVDAPRFHHQWLPDRLVVEFGGLDADTRAALTALGHDVVERPPQGSAQSIWVDPETGVPAGIADHRSPDAAAVAARPSVEPSR